uniref:NADH dehydrogenase [ubiquinone] 1 beta subcomplex subunit 8, mitochondrial n=1 Tax=Angiostrongylus cantonensis TaxID=6313 RepID=A0A0K0DBU4_ANGCA
MFSPPLREFSRRSLHTSCVLSLRGPLTFPGWYPRDHKPGPYAMTEDERRAAAIKYGLRLEDYKPMNQDDVVRYAGDYPDLGVVTYDHKDPYEAWTDRLNRRNWGEMVPMDFIRHRGDRVTFTGLEAEDFTTWKAIIFTLRVLVPMVFLSYLFCNEDPNAFRWKNPAMPKQYPYDFYRAFPFDEARRFPITNYSFDLCE